MQPSSHPHLTLVSVQQTPRTRAVRAQHTNPPSADQVISQAHIQIWIGFIHAGLAPLALLVPHAGLIPVTFILCGIMMVAASAKMVQAATQPRAHSHAYVIWALQATIGTAAVVSFPLLGIASFATALAVYFALQAAATAYMAGAPDANRPVWSMHAGLSATLGVACLLFQDRMPFWVIGVFLAMDLGHAGVSFTRAGVAAIARQPVRKLLPPR